MDDLDPGADPQLRAELEAARSWGVSWRRFCGWEPQRVTTYEYDDDGRLIRAVTTTEAEWDDEQRDAVYALARFEAGLCPGCRQPIAETTAPEAEFAYKELETLRCFRCQATEVVQGTYEGDPHPATLLFQIGREASPDGRW